MQSYRDLPLLINQWANVVRWELRPRLLLRTSEFLWQEGHTAHATEEEARGYAVRILRDVYEDFMVDVLALPVVVGRKTARERFAGATNTMTLELMTGDGKALQMGTSHELGQNFAKAFGIEFLAPNGQREHAWQTSWGSSTRMVGGLIMAHGDDGGLRVPPRLAPTQVVVLAIKAAAAEAAHRIADQLRAGGSRVEVDDAVPTSRSAGARSTGSSRACRSGSRSGRATWPRTAPCWSAGCPAPSRRCRWAGSSTPSVSRWSPTRSRCTPRPSGGGTRGSSTPRPSTTRWRPRRAGWARMPWSELGIEGEARLAEQSVSVRCLTRAGRVAAGGRGRA